MRPCAARCALRVALFGLHAAGNVKSPAGQCLRGVSAEIGGGPILVNRPEFAAFLRDARLTLTALSNAPGNPPLPTMDDCASVRRRSRGHFTRTEGPFHESAAV